MSSTTVSEFANELKKTPDTLLEQLRLAGVAKASSNDALTDADKQKLLSYLQISHGTATGERKKISIVKKSTSEIKQADATGKARTIQVEVRKKRTFIQRDEEANGETHWCPTVEKRERYRNRKRSDQPRSNIRQKAQYRVDWLSRSSD